MRNIEATINGQPIDLESVSGIPIKLNYLLQDLENFDKRGGYFSNQFSIPATKRMNELFGHFYSPSVLNSYQKFTSKFPFRVDINGHNIFQGLLTGESAERKRGRSLSYKCQMIGQNMVWAELLKSTKLIDSIPFNSYTWDAAAVKNSWANTWDVGGYVHPMVAHGGWANLAGSGVDHIEYWELRPFIFARGIVEKMFNSNGYNLVSSFMQADLFSKLIVYFNDDDSMPTEVPLAAPTIDYSVAGLISDDTMCIDFLKGLIGMFNLYFFTDENTKTVYCEPYDDFFSGFDNWDAYQNIRNSSKLTPYSGEQFIEFIYDTEGDSVHEFFNENDSENFFPLTWGKTKKHFNCRYDFERGTDSIKEIKNSFFKGATTTGVAYSISGVEALLPILYDGDIDYAGASSPETLGKSSGMSGRILYYAGLVDPNISWKFEADAPRTDFPYAYFENFGNYHLSSTINLNYSDSVYPVPGLAKGLVSSYFLNRLASMKRGSVLDTEEVLKVSDIAKLDFRKLKSVEQVLWILLELNISARWEPAKIKMLQRVLADATDYNSLTHYDDATGTLIP